MNTPLTLTPIGGPTYSLVSGRLLHFFQGAWLVDVEISAKSLQLFGMPSGSVALVFGGTMMTGTIDPTASGSFGQISRARVVAGAGAWAAPAPAQNWHFDNGVLSTTVYQATAEAIGETLVNLAPTFFNVDFARAGAPSPASAVFRDNPWFVDVTGITNVGPRPPGVPNPSLVIRDWDPVSQKVTFSCSSLLLPNTTLIDARFNGATPTVYDVEQVFDGEGSIGWAWSDAQPGSQLAGDLKAATLYWTRAAFLRAYRYRLVSYQGPGPGGGPSRLALQAVTPSTGIPDLLPIAPWSGVAGIVSELAPSQEVLIVFENADPTLPRIVDYSLTTGLPLTTTIDAQTMLAVGPTVPFVQLAGGTGGPLVLAGAYAGLLAALGAFAAALPPGTPAAVNTASAALTAALAALPPAATAKVTGA